MILFAKLEILHEKSHDNISVGPRSKCYIQKFKVAFLSFSFSRGNRKKLMLSAVKNIGEMDCCDFSDYMFSHFMNLIQLKKTATETEYTFRD